MTSKYRRSAGFQLPSELYELGDSYFDLWYRDTELLYAIRNYWNGLGSVKLKDDIDEPPNEPSYIGADYPPSLAELLYADADDIQLYRDAVERLQERGILKSDYLCRTEVNYLLTQRGKLLFEEIFSKIPYDIDVVFHGDDRGLLTHHFLTAAADIVMPSDSFLGYPSSQQLRPYGLDTGPTPDSFHPLDHRSFDIAIEAWTGNHDYKRAIKKCRAWNTRDVFVIWVFPDAKTAANLINKLERNDSLRFDFPNAPLNNPENYRLNRLRDYRYRPEAVCTGFGDILTATYCVEDIPNNSYERFYGLGEPA